MKSILFTLNETSAKYVQIYSYFKSLIESGELQSGEQLPSIRKLAEDLHISRNTTLTAYEQLTAEGYITGEGRIGYFVNSLEPQFYSKPIAVTMSKVELPSSTIDFRAGAVDQQHFPLKAWRKLSNAVLTSADAFHYGDPFGEIELCQQIAHYLLESRGVKTNAHAIIIGSSTQQLLIQLGHLLKENFSSIVVEDPGFDGAREAFSFHNYAFETLEVTENGADFTPLEKAHAQLIYVTPSHQSPLGVSMTIQQRQQLIQWANKRQGYIIEDDYDSEFRYTQRPFPALASIDAKRVIYLGNFSKAFLPGIRMSYMALPESLLSSYKEKYAAFESTTSLISQMTMARFMQNGEWTRHLKRMRLVYKRKMQCLVTALKEAFNDRIHIIGEQSGLYIVAQFQLEQSENELIQQAASSGVKVYATSNYFLHRQTTEPLIKLGFGQLNEAEIIEGVSLLKKAWLK